MERLFFALWPDAPAAAALATLAKELAARSGGTSVPPAKIHLTLAFLGDVAGDRMEAAMRAPEGARWRGFDMVLDTVGSFRGARVAWAGCRERAAELVELQSGLAGRLAEGGFALDDRPYTPHVTLARKIARPIRPGGTTPIAWHATELALVRSETGKGTYATLASWPLG
jgi:2'-5' RNA ligase